MDAAEESRGRAYAVCLDDAQVAVFLPCARAILVAVVVVVAGRSGSAVKPHFRGLMRTTC